MSLINDMNYYTPLDQISGFGPSGSYEDPTAPGYGYASDVEYLRTVNPIYLTDQQGLMAYGPQWAWIKGTDWNLATSPEQPLGSPTFGPRPPSGYTPPPTNGMGPDGGQLPPAAPPPVAPPPANGMGPDGGQLPPAAPPPVNPTSPIAEDARWTQDNGYNMVSRGGNTPFLDAYRRVRGQQQAKGPVSSLFAQELGDNG